MTDFPDQPRMDGSWRNLFIYKNRRIYSYITWFNLYLYLFDWCEFVFSHGAALFLVFFVCFVLFCLGYTLMSQSKTNYLFQERVEEGKKSRRHFFPSAFFHPPGKPRRCTMKMGSKIKTVTQKENGKRTSALCYFIQTVLRESPPPVLRSVTWSLVQSWLYLGERTGSPALFLKTSSQTKTKTLGFVQRKWVESDWRLSGPKYGSWSICSTWRS